MKPATTYPVQLVGAGPGDPELLTIKAVKAISAADVLLVDDLVDRAVFAHFKPGARVIEVGKRGGCKSTPQEFIERLLVREAQAGHRVVRLKGGDPFVFGRGGEEQRALHAAGLQVEVIPGITAGVAAPASIGVAVTDRLHAAGVAFVTGHSQDGGSEPDWDALARSGLTLVIYMGLTRCAAITAKLAAAGLPADTPAAVIQQAHTPAQRSHVTTLARLAADIEARCFAAPAILVVGDVVQMASAAALPALPGAALSPAKISTSRRRAQQSRRAGS